MIKIIVLFDMEGVLVNGELLPELAKYRGESTARKVYEITQKGIRGEINWEDGLYQRVEYLGGLTRGQVRTVAYGLPLMEGAEYLCGRLKRMGGKLVSVTGGFSELTYRVKEELNLDRVFCNEFVYNGDVLNGYNLRVTSNKAENLTDELLRELGYKLGETIAIVDGVNDLKLFDLAALKIAFNAQDEVQKRADVIIEKKDLSEAWRHIEVFSAKL